MRRLANFSLSAWRSGSVTFPQRVGRFYNQKYLPKGLPSVGKLDRCMPAFNPACHYKYSAGFSSQRPVGSSTSNLDVGEPPIDEKLSERGVTESSMNKEHMQGSAQTARGQDKETTPGQMSGQTPAPHLGKETNIREMLHAKAKETEERLSHEGKYGGSVGRSPVGQAEVASRMIDETEGKSVWALGMRVTVKCPGEKTEGSYCLLEYNVAPGEGSQTHTHSREDETWYMLEGEMQWRLREKIFEAKKGSFIHLPLGVPHGFHNSSREPARMLVSCLPAGLENYFLDIGVPVDPDPKAKKPAVTENDAKMATEAGRKYGVSFSSAH